MSYSQTEQTHNGQFFDDFDIAGQSVIETKGEDGRRDIPTDRRSSAHTSAAAVGGQRGRSEHTNPFDDERVGTQVIPTDRGDKGTGSRIIKVASYVNTYSEEHTSNHADTVAKLNRKYAYALLALALLVVVASAAVLAALYAPDHMPTAISAIVNNLTPFMKDVITGVACATGALGLLGVAYTGTELYNNKPNKLSLSMFNCCAKKSDTFTYDLLQAEEDQKQAYGSV